jgi:uncharacterized delta-60 repeat protein
MVVFSKGSFWPQFECNFSPEYQRRIGLIGCVLFLLFALGLSASWRTAWAAEGELDQTFGTGGKVTLGVPGNDDYGRAVTIQRDGKIILVGQSGVYPLFHSAVMRLNPNGSLDPTFGNNGTVIAALDPGGDILTSVTMQPDGKIVAGGTLIQDNWPVGFVVARFNSNGSLDQSFGSGGLTITTFGDPASEANVVLLQSDGKIILVGYSGAGSYSELNDFAIARYTSNGSLDPTFGNGGKLKTHFEGDTNTGTRGADAVLQPDGKLIVAGQYKTELVQRQFALARYNTNGDLDTSFGNDGKVTTLLGQFNAYAQAIALQSDGKIVLAGYKDARHNNDFALVRYNANGSLDTTFASAGIAVNDLFGSSDDAAYALTIQPDGRIIASGRTGQYPSFRFGLARYNVNGTFDQSFGTAGKMLTDFGGSTAQSYGAARQSDGKLLVVGYAISGTTGADFNVNFAVARYLLAAPQTRAPFDFDGDRKTDVSIFRSSVGEWWYRKSSDGQTRTGQFGSSSDILTPGDFTGDGKTDLAVFHPATGEWFVLRSDDNSYFAIQFGQAGDIPSPSDFDGDGKTDAAVFRPSQGLWFILRSSDSGVAFVPFGTAGDQPVSADYDADGKADVAIVRNISGGIRQWWLQRSTLGVAVLNFGVTGDKTVQGDYTGDGKADIAVFHPPTGEWFVLRSEDFSYFGFQWGANGDIPVPGDYDGDGKFEAAVFRPSDTTWYINQTFGGPAFINFGLGTDNPVPSVFVR